MSFVNNAAVNDCQELDRSQPFLFLIYCIHNILYH